MELACTALNTRPNAMIRKMENSTPIQRMPRPFFHVIGRATAVVAVIVFLVL